MGFSIQFSGAETSIDTGGARATLTLQGYGWGSALRSAGPVTQMEPKGKRLERHYGTALTEWFLNTPQGLEQGFVIAHRAKQAGGALHIRLTAAGGWSVDGSGDRVQLMKGAVTLDYAGLKAWDAMGAVIPSRLRGSGTSIEIEVDDAGAVYPLSIDPTFTQQQELTPSDAACWVTFLAFPWGCRAMGTQRWWGHENPGIGICVHALRRSLDPAAETDRVRWGGR